MKISRRSLFRAGLACSVFPWAHEALAGPSLVGPRLVLLMQTNGTHPAAFWPSGTTLESTPLLAPLMDKPALRSQLTLIGGLFNHSRGAGNEHDIGFAGLWTGRPTVGTFNEPWGNDASIDQQLRVALRPSEPFPTLNTAVLASTSALFKAHRWSFSYLGPGRQIPAEIDPWKLYARFFAPASSSAEATTRLAESRSVLDFVHQDLRSLRLRLPASERPRLDAHEAALRSHERRLELLVDQQQGAPACANARAPGAPIDLFDENNVPRLVELMSDFIALALSCGLTRIVNFQLGQSGERWRFSWLGINENSHDDIAHRDSGTDPATSAKSIAINLWYAQRVAALAEAMHRLPGGRGTLLEDSLLVWGNEMATGPHGMDGIPVVLLGGACGQLTGGRMVHSGPQTYQRLGTSVLRLMGVQAEGFGDAPTCGPIVGL